MPLDTSAAVTFNSGPSQPAYSSRLNYYSYRADFASQTGP